LSAAFWSAEGVGERVQDCVVAALGDEDGALIANGMGFLKKGARDSSTDCFLALNELANRSFLASDGIFQGGERCISSIEKGLWPPFQRLDCFLGRLWQTTH
jgi:hypothetical protein